MDEETEVKFFACKHLDYDRTNYVTSVNMNLISHFQDTKVTWDRRDVDGNMQLVQFCKKRGRLNHPTACLGINEPFVCPLFELYEHCVPMKDINLD